jgi:hypothetical protein
MKEIKIYNRDNSFIIIDLDKYEKKNNSLDYVLKDGDIVWDCYEEKYRFIREGKWICGQIINNLCQSCNYYSLKNNKITRKIV